MPHNGQPLLVEPERSGEEGAIGALTAEAFHNHPYSHGQEPAVIEALRRDGALTLSLVARSAGEIVGHVAASPAKIVGAPDGWFGLGPLSVLPGQQRQGIGGQLMRSVLEQLRQSGARGCVLVGPPEYYKRFGFEVDPTLIHPGIPPEYCLCLRFVPNTDAGTVAFHTAFSL